jgi:hypothetical protein
VAEGGGVIAPPGWFADPIGRSDLRWWSGAEWTEHVAPAPVMHPADVPRPGTVLAGAPIPVPQPGSVVAPQPTTSAYVPFGGDSRGANSATADPRSWVPSGPIAPTHWNTGGAWALSATPLIGVLGGVGIGFAVSLAVSLAAPSLLWLSLVIALLPFLWTVAAATRDCAMLDAFGFGRLPSRWWLLLGPLAYLIVRTVHVRRQSGRGSAPLWWYCSIVMVLAGVSIGVRLLVAVTPGVLLPTS